MSIAASIALGLCLVLTCQCAFVAAFLWMMKRHRRPTADVALPKAGVVLALRGPDPFLDDCLRRLLAQDYHDYTVHLIVDSTKDPVLEDIHRLIKETAATNVVVSILRDPFGTCSLKCSALIQAVQELDASHEVVAFLDGDALPHPTWLRELVAPLADSTVGVTYGNRWYVPTTKIGAQWCGIVGMSAP